MYRQIPYFPHYCTSSTCIPGGTPSRTRRMAGFSAQDVAQGAVHLDPRRRGLQMDQAGTWRRTSRRARPGDGPEQLSASSKRRTCTTRRSPPASLPGAGAAQPVQTVSVTFARSAAGRLPGRSDVARDQGTSSSSRSGTGMRRLRFSGVAGRDRRRWCAGRAARTAPGRRRGRCGVSLGRGPRCASEAGRFNRDVERVAAGISGASTNAFASQESVSGTWCAFFAWK